MKKGWLQKVMSVTLATAMVLGLGACGRGGGGIHGGNVSQDPNLAKQYVYSCEEFEIPKLGDDFRLFDMKKVDDRIYWAVFVYHWDDYERNDVRLLSVKEDGTDLQEVALIMPEVDTGSAADGPGVQEAEPQETETETSETEAGGVDGDFAVEIPMDPDLDYGSNVYENTSYNQIIISEAGTVYATENYYYGDYSDPENEISISRMALCSWDLDGNLLWKQPIEELSSESADTYVSKSINTMIPKQDGSLDLVIYDYEEESVCVWTVDNEGNLDTGAEPLNDPDNIFRNMSSVLVGDDGQMYLYYWNEKDNYNYYIAVYDIERGSFVGESMMLPYSLNYSGFRDMVKGVGSDLMFAMSNGVYSYNLGDEELTQVMNFVNSDLDSSNMSEILPLDEDRFVGFYYTRSDYELKGGIFTKVDPEDIPDKQVLVLGGQYIDWETMARVTEFNKTNDSYRIVLREYEQYNTVDDYMAGYTQLNSDVLSGNMPDILIVNSNTNVNAFISKGYLANVEDLIKQDEELSQSKFLQNVFDACRVDGKLYQVVPYFYVRTLVGKQSLLGDRTGWTMPEYLEFLSTLPEGTEGIGELTRNSFMYTMMSYCGSDFVDVSTGKCDFDSENFIAMLEYAATLPESFEYSEDYWMSYESQYREDRTVLYDTMISDIQYSLVRTINGLFGEDITYIGFPTDSGKGSVIWQSNSYVLSAQSANLEGAWEFVRYWLTDEYQDNLNGYLPVSEKAFDAMMAKGMEKPTYEDENGELVEYDMIYWLNEEEIVMPPLTQEQVDQASDFIRSVDKRYYNNSDVLNIINEEADAFFSGQKSAEAVADIIQSRVQIFVNENQ